MKYLKLFENFKGTKNKSKLPKDLYNELLPLFDPKYLLDRPSGYSLEVIEMTFNDKVKYDDVIDIIIDSNWYVVKYYRNGDEIRKIEIRPKYSNFVTEEYPNKVYHISPSSNDESIIKNGLKSTNSKKMGINYPNRIYLVSDIDLLKTFTKQLNWYVGEKDWTIWKIDLSKLNIDYLYVDETVNHNLRKPKAFYLQEVDIPKEAIEKYNKIEL